MMEREQVKTLNTEVIVEELCLKGCQSVRQDIKLLKRGVVLPELEDFDEIGRQAILKELESIMAVYGDACPMEKAARAK
jgi:hypothetical protein